MDIRGKVALVTGGGTGLGREISLALGREGMTVVVSYSRSQEDAEGTAADIRAAGGEASTLQADLASTSAARRLVADVEAAHGRLDLLIHNAGTTRFIAFKDIDAVTDEAWDEILAVNLKAAFALAQAAAPIMRRNGGGQIITTSSIAGLAPIGSSIPYAVSKAALIHLTKCLAVALAPDIRVNTVAPGLILTRWVAGFSTEHIQAATESSFLKHTAELEDVSNAFVMLAKNSSITGQEIVVDSGQLMV